jgi:hypothetical protein
MRSRTAAICLALLATAGCEGTLQLGTNDGGEADAGDADTSDANDSGRSGFQDAGKESGSYSPDANLPLTNEGGSDAAAIMAALTPGGGDDAGTCVQACSATPGASIPLTHGTELVGTWRICSGSLGSSPPDTIGIELSSEVVSSDGDRAYYLVAGPSGEPVRGTGFAYEATWTDVCGAYVSVTTGSQTTLYQPILSECPRQVWMTFVKGDVGCSG